MGRAATFFRGIGGQLIALMAVFLFFSVLLMIKDYNLTGNLRMPTIATLVGIEKIVSYSVVVGIAALGMTLVIISGGIDLSAGSVIAFCSVSAAFILMQMGAPPEAAALGALAAGMLCGLANGLLITRLGMVPFIITLGMMLIVRGVAKGVAIGGAKTSQINIEHATWLDALMAPPSDALKWTLFPIGGWIMFVLAAATAWFLRYTRRGRHIFAVGSNEQTARLCGVAVERVKVFVYVTAGAFAGLAGLMLMSYQTMGDPKEGVGLELDVIAAVVIGGGSLSGGEGSILGTLIGTMIIVVIRTGCQLMGWDTWVIQIATGAAIIVAVVVDRMRHRRAALV